MSDTDEAAGRAATRRRWITLGEVLAVAAVAISALTLWDSHEERVRTSASAERAATRAAADAAALVLRAAPSRDGERLALSPINRAQAIQAQHILFPSDLGIAPVETSGDSRIETAWFDDALKKALRTAGVDEDAPGDLRLPVVIATDYVVDGKQHVARAIYDLGYVLDGRFLGGHAVVLRGMSLISSVSEAAAQRTLDARWRKRRPAKARTAA